MWEDERNRRGGRWLITLSKQQRKSDLDHFWLETVSSGLGFLEKKKKSTRLYELKEPVLFFCSFCASWVKHSATSVTMCVEQSLMSAQKAIKWQSGPQTMKTKRPSRT